MESTVTKNSIVTLNLLNYSYIICDAKGVFG